MQVATQNSTVPKLRFKEFSGDYKKVKLGSILTRYSEKNKDEEFNIDDILSLSSRYGIVDRKELLEDTYSKVNHKAYIKTRLNDFVYGKSISSNYPYGLFKANKTRDGLLSTLYFTFKVNNSAIPDYLDCYYSHFNRANNYLKKFVLVGDRYITADSDFILSGEIFVPTLPEQEKIASFLSAVDKRIQKLERKKSLLAAYKKGVMHQLFSQEIRFKDEHGNHYPDWEEKKIEEIVREIKNKTTVNNQYPILSSSKVGLQLQEDYFTKQTASINNTGYKILIKDDFTYRSMSDTGSFTFNQQNIIDTGIVSPAYPVFRCEKNTRDTFLHFYLNNTSKVKRQILTLKEGGTRYAMGFSKFKNLIIELPSLEEQQKIASFLSGVDKKIELVETQIQQSKTFKKGLLQQLFV